MSTAFRHSDSYVLPYCPLVAISDETEFDIFELDQEEVSASQALAVYRRVVDSSEMDTTSEYANLDAVQDRLVSLSIDELRRLADELRLPEPGTITEKTELIAEIRRRL